jgi:CubicO group peptidase (beta-lactamase class C family)
MMRSSGRIIIESQNLTHRCLKAIISIRRFIEKTMKQKPRLFLCLITLGFLLPAATLSRAQRSAQVKPPLTPNTAAGRRLIEWQRAYNSGDYEQTRKFMADNYAKAVLDLAAADVRANNVVNALRVNGKMKIIAIEKSSETDIVALLETQLTELQSRLTIKVAVDEPHIITAINLTSIQPAVNPGAPKLSEAKFGRWLDGYLKRLTAADVFSGSVVVAKNGKPIFQNAYGLASKAYNIPNRIDTKFNLGSMNKMFTAVAIAQLVEQGKLSFDDTVGKVLPDYPNKEVAAKVTLHHLLTHTSGLGDYFTPTFFETSKDRFKSVKDYLPLFVDQPLLFQPGERMSYSNAGFMLLGAIIEKASGQDYFTYVRDHVYKPAGMNDTDAYELDHDTPNLAIGYTSEDDNGRYVPGPRSNNLFSHVVKGGPAGGGFSTAPDLLRFTNALVDDKLVSRQSREILTTGKVAYTPGVKYGYGFICSEINGRKVFGHSGGFLGINSELEIHLDTGYTIIVMSNYDPPIAQLIVKRIGQVIQEG